MWARCLQLLDSRTHTCPLSLVHPIFQADKNLKDWILFRSSSRLLECIDTFRDNTGTKEYIENQIFPTTRFPSDHALVSSVSCPCFFFFIHDELLRTRSHARTRNLTQQMLRTSLFEQKQLANRLVAQGPPALNYFTTCAAVCLSPDSSLFANSVLESAGAAERRQETGRRRVRYMHRHACVNFRHMQKDRL